MISASEQRQAMQPLGRALRGKLERVIRDARDIAESGAAAALQQLGVGDASPPGYLKAEERDLRKKLRAHGRQLGDKRDPKTEAQAVDRLAEEVAYEHWHRMLFARFLAENNLLMYPGSPPVAITLEECEDLAEEVGAKDGWELASRFASQMLPQIFRADSAVFKLQLPAEHAQKLEDLVRQLPSAVFAASDSLGWIYQFWQSKRKDEVNAREAKIGARELPAVTQLFTEPYMVSFLLDNSLGAWWATRRLTEDDLRDASSEEELRRKASILGVPLTYLRFIHRDDGCWLPATGSFDSWPQELNKFKSIDPCCGSGHFLVAAFLMLVPMRMELEGMSARQAVDCVLAENIHGLEIDKRCVELAAFALALSAWRYPNAGGYRTLPRINVACSGLSLSLSKDQWKDLALDKHNLRIALEWIHDTFKDAPIAGSLLNPTKTDAAKLLGWEDLSVALEQAFNREPSDEEREASVVAQGLAHASLLLSRQYDWVLTNVPYLQRTKQDDSLKGFCDVHYPDSRNDLAPTFLERCIQFCKIGGYLSVVSQENWLFLSTYSRFRELFLGSVQMSLVCKLGAGAFETITGEHVKPSLIVGVKTDGVTMACFPGKAVFAISVNNRQGISDKQVGLLTGQLQKLSQEAWCASSGQKITFSEDSAKGRLNEYATSHLGICTGDFPRFGRMFWELPARSSEWQYQQTSTEAAGFYGGFTNLLLWEGGRGKLLQFLIERLGPNGVNSWLRGRDAWNKRGIAVTATGKHPVSLYVGSLFDNNVSVLIPKDESLLPALWMYCASPEFHERVRSINTKLAVTDQSFVEVPFDEDRWVREAETKLSGDALVPYSDDPRQWVFHGHPFRSLHPLHVCVCRLLGYRWPAETDASITLSSKGAELINRVMELIEFEDADGIVCLPAVRGEFAAVDRILRMLSAAYGDSWNQDLLSQLLKNEEHAGKSLESWLREKFFIQHCQIFMQRPFIWHIWDGLRDGFAALVNYHKLDRKLLESLIYGYLGDWIARQKEDTRRGMDGAEERLNAAELLKKRLELILQGEAPCDIFVRWKSAEQQPVGWEPDLNDGVRVNIRPFLTVPDVGKKGAGVLRDKPTINWGKDRGKDTPSSPWYHLFQGDRINDHHLTLREKIECRGTRR